MLSKNKRFANNARFLALVAVSVFIFIGHFQSDDAYSQTGNRCEIVGKVRSLDTHEALIGVNVYLKNTTYGAPTDKEGNFEIKGIPAGTYTLIATYTSYKNYSQEIELTPGQILHRDIELEYSIHMFDEIVVTGTRQAREIKEVPIRTEVITPAEFKKKEAKTVFQALDALPGIRVEEQCSNCNFSMLRMEGLEGGYSQVLIDGMPSFSGLAGVYGLQQLQTSGLEQIEVVKGAGSALYGSDALGGVVNIITKKPGVLPEYSFGSSVGSHGTQNYYMSGSQRLHRFGILFSAQRDFEGAIDQTGGELASFKDIGKDNYTDRVDSDKMGANATVFIYDPFGVNSTFKVIGRVNDEFRKGGNLDTWDDPFDPDSEHIKTTRYEAGFGLDKIFDNEREIAFEYQYVDHYRNATNGAAWDKAIEGGMLDDDLELTALGQNYLDTHGFEGFRSEWYPKPFIVQEYLHIADSRYSQPIGSSESHFLAGIQYKRSDLEQNINGSKNDKNANDLGIYAQADIHFRENLELVTGLRFDYHKSEDSFTSAEYDTKVLNPRLALRWNPNENLTFRASAGMGYRVPYLFAEDMHLCASAPRIFKGADLDPERATSFSTGLDYYKSNYRIGLSIFHTNIEDKIEFITPDDGDVPSGFDYRWVNLGKAYTQGFDLTYAGMTYNTKLQYDFNVTYVNAKLDEPRYTADNYPTVATNDGYKNSDYIPRSPKWSGNASFTVNFPQDVQLYFHTKYTGSMFIDHVPGDDGDLLVIEETDDYFIFDSKLSKKINKRFDFFIGGKNLFDYTQKRRDNSDAAYIYAPLYGRILYSGFEINLN